MSNEAKNNAPQIGAHCPACEGEAAGATFPEETTAAQPRRLSLDSWAVLLALAAAALVKLHILNSVKW